MAGAATAPTGPTPIAVAVLTTVNVSWTASTMSGASVAGYRIRRYAALGGAEATVGGTCAGTVTTTSCSDSGVAIGGWRYTVTPMHRSWTGREGALSITVAVSL